MKKSTSHLKNSFIRAADDHTESTMEEEYTGRSRPFADSSENSNISKSLDRKSKAELIEAYQELALKFQAKEKCIAKLTSTNKELVNQIRKEETKADRLSEDHELEVKIKESELLYSTLFYQSPGMKTIIDTSTRKYLDVNFAFTEFLGKTREDIIGKTLFELKITTKSEDWDRALNQLRTLGFFNDFETQIISANGGDSWVSIDASTIKFDDKDCILTEVVDITKRKRAEKELLQLNKELEQRVAERTEKLTASEDLLHKSNALARIGSWEVDLLKETIYWDNITREIHEADNGFTPDLATGINFYKEGPGRELITQRVKEAIELGKPWDLELEIVTAKNNVRWIHTIGEPEVVNGKCVKIYGSFQDIDERKKAEEKLNESSNRYRRLFDTSPIAITEEDHTPFYEKIENLRASGISKNYATYFDNHSEELYEMLGKVQILGVNQSLLDLTGANNLEDFVANRSKFFVSMTERTVFKLMDLIRDGGGYFEEETKIKALSGEIKEVVVRLKYPESPPYNSVAITMRDVTKQKEFQQKIKESEEKFRNAFNASPDAIFLSSVKSGKILEINEGFIKNFGVNSEEAIGKSASELSLFNDKELISFKISNKEIKSDFTSLEIIYLNRAKGELYGLLSFRSMFWNNEECVMYFLRDISERKKAEEELRLSQYLTRKIFDSGIIGFIFWDSNGEILDANDHFLEMSGYSRRDLDEKKINWTQMTPPEYAELDLKGLEEISQTGICKLFEKEYIRKDGSRLPVLLGATSFEGQNAERGVAYVMDITDRKNSEREIKNYQDALDQSSIVAITDQKGIIQHVNENFCRISKYTAGELIGQDHRIINSGYHPKSFIKNLWKTIAQGKIWRGEMCNKAKDGTIYWVDTTIVPLLNDHGKPFQYIAIRADITDRKNAEEENNKTSEQIRILISHIQTIREEERKRIAREIHDHMGQQLTAIKMDAVWIDKQISPDQFALKGKLQNIIELLDESHHSVHTILNELRPTVLDNNGLLEGLQWLGKQFTETTGTPLRFQCNLGNIRLQQETSICIFRVYQESLTNIMRYAGASKVVSSLNVFKDKLALTIEDDGKGFNMDSLQYKKSFGLLGMKERVHYLNGKIDFVSSPGKGTKIVINLPYKKYME